MHDYLFIGFKIIMQTFGPRDKMVPQRNSTWLWNATKKRNKKRKHTHFTVIMCNHGFFQKEP